MILRKQTDFIRSGMAASKDWAARFAEWLVRGDSFFDRYPEEWVRITSYPLDFKADWMTERDKYLVRMYAVDPVTDKEPEKLGESRLWC